MVVIPSEGIESVLENSERLVALERQVNEGLLNKRDPGEVFESVKRFEHIRLIEPN